MQDFTPLDGGCRCGQIRFRMIAEPIITHCCHCRTCQRVAGSAFRVNVMIETERLSITQGEPELHDGALQCPSCRAVIWGYLPQFGQAIAFVGVGMLDEGERLSPEAHYFVRSKHPWVTLPPDVPAFEQLGDPGKPGARERVTAALAALSP